MRRTPNVDADAPPPPGGTITAIVASPRAPGRFSVMVDGKAAHTLGLAAIERLGLSVGATTVGREEIIAREEGLLRTYDRAVMMLAARGRAAKDLERLLVRKGEPAEFARLAVERLALEGFVDDDAYARSFVRSKSSGAGLARRRLQQELARKGVERAVADDEIAEVFAEEEVDEVAAATALARKRARSLGGIDAQSQRRRIYSFLARRGYSPDIISSAIRSATASSSGGDGVSDDDSP
jgi:regulatory protein